MKVCCVLMIFTLLGCGDDEYPKTNIAVSPDVVDLPNANAENVPYANVLQVGGAVRVPEYQNSVPVANILRDQHDATAHATPVLEVIPSGSEHSSNEGTLIVGLNEGKLSARPVGDHDSTDSLMQKVYFWACRRGLQTPGTFVLPAFGEKYVAKILNRVVSVDGMVWMGIGNALLNVPIPSAMLVEWASTFTDDTVRLEKVAEPLAEDLFKKTGWLEKLISTLAVPSDPDTWTIKHRIVFWFNGGPLLKVTDKNKPEMRAAVEEQIKKNGSVCHKFFMLNEEQKEGNDIIECQRKASIDEIVNVFMEELEFQSLSPVPGIPTSSEVNMMTGIPTSSEVNMIRQILYRGKWETPISMTGYTPDEIEKSLIAAMAQILPVDVYLWHILFPDINRSVGISVYTLAASFAGKDALNEISTKMARFILKKADLNQKDLDTWANNILTPTILDSMSEEKKMSRWINGGPETQFTENSRRIIEKIVRKEVGHNGNICEREKYKAIDILVCERDVEEHPERINEIVTAIYKEGSEDEFESFFKNPN